MPEDFVPTTKMERAYVQARHWPAERAWRRAYIEVAEGQVASGIGMYMTLLDYYARRDSIKDLYDTCEWILNHTEDLKRLDRHSVVRIVCSIVKSLKEDEFDVNEARLKLILRIPLALILENVAQSRLSCALSGLLEFSRVFEESISLKELAELEGDFSSVAKSIDRNIRAGVVRDHIMESEARTLKELDNDLDVVEQWKRKKAAEKKAFEQSVENIIDDANSSVEEPPPAPIGKSSAELPGWTPASPPLAGETSSGGFPAQGGRTEADKLLKAESEVDSAINKYGLQSAEVAHKLANLIEVKTEELQDPSLADELTKLNAILSEQKTDISPYVLRKILWAVGKADEKKELLALLTSIEEAVLLKREDRIGLDVSLGFTLWRLVWLWRRNDCLPEGNAFCTILLQRLVDSRDENDLVVRQVMSAMRFLVELQNSATIAAQESPTKQVSDIVEFAAMLSTLALDHIIHGRADNAEQVLNELLLFYSDTVGDTSRRVGEMAWLLMETKLYDVNAFYLSLIRCSAHNAWDDYLNARLDTHIKRLLSRLDSNEKKSEVIACLILAKGINLTRGEPYSKAMHELQSLLALSTFVPSFAQEADEESRRLEWKDSESSTTMNVLEYYVSTENWESLYKTFDAEKAQIEINANFYRLIEIGIHALNGGQVEFAKQLFDHVNRHTSATSMYAFNYFAEQLKTALLTNNELEEAMMILFRCLVNKHQTVEHGNNIRLQLAELKAMTGNIFEATALIYQAFSEIPDASTSTAPLNLLEAKQGEQGDF